RKVLQVRSHLPLGGRARQCGGRVDAGELLLASRAQRAEEDGLDPLPWRAADHYVPPARLESAAVDGERVVAVNRDDHVVALPVLAEALSRVVDHPIRAQRSCLIEVAGAGDSGHVGPEG